MEFLARACRITVSLLCVASLALNPLGACRRLLSAATATHHTPLSSGQEKGAPHPSAMNRLKMERTGHAPGRAVSGPSRCRRAARRLRGGHPTSLAFLSHLISMESFSIFTLSATEACHSHSATAPILLGVASAWVTAVEHAGWCDVLCCEIDPAAALGA